MKVTGLGILCALGNNKDEVFQKLLELQGVERAAYFRKPSHLETLGSQVDLPLVAEVPLSNKELISRIGGKRSLFRRTSRAGLLAIHAVKEAAEDSGLLESGIASNRIGIFCGSSLGGTTDLEILYREYVKRGKTNYPHLLLSGGYGILNDQIAQLFGWHGHRAVVSTACSSSTVVMHLAKRELESGRLDATVVYGVDPIGELSVAGFRSLGGLSKTITSPFSEGEYGLSLGEGAAALVLETKPRNKKIYAHLAGVAVTSEAYHATAPEPSGRGAKTAMLGALSEAGATTTEVQSIYAHGTGTELNDPAETKAIKALFADHAPHLRLISTKGATGHTLGGAGAINAVLACLSIDRASLPPSPGFSSARRGCTLPIADPLSRVRGSSGIIANSFGFGGSNASAFFSTKQAQTTESSPQPVWITGVGSVTPFGSDTNVLETAILEGKQAVAEHSKNTCFTGRYHSHFAGTVNLQEPLTATLLRKSRNSRKMDRLSSLAFLSASGAIANASLKINSKNREKVGLYYGTDTGPLEVIHQFYLGVVQNGNSGGNPSLFPNTVLNACLGYINIDHLIQGASLMISQGEVASGVAMDFAASALSSGRGPLEGIICGGVDEYSEMLEKGYLDLKHIPSNECPQNALRPLDRSAHGYLLGEASIAFFLEAADPALIRGANPLGIYLGSLISGAQTPGAHHYAQSGESIRSLLDEAVVRYGRCDLIIMNASGLPSCDRVLTEGVLSSSVKDVAVYSPLGLFGNCRGTSSALGVFAAMTALKHQQVPPMPGCRPTVSKLRVNGGQAKNAKIDRVFVLTTSCGGYTVLNAIGKGGTE